MNWKQEAIEKLNRYGAMVQALENIPKQIKLLEQSVTQMRGIKPRQLSRVTPQRGDDYLINNLVKRQEMALSYKNAKLWVDTVDRALKVLDEKGQKVLMALYAYPMCGNVNRLCEELGVEQSTLYRKRDEALYQFTMALYGAVQQ